MARNGAGTYSLPAGSVITNGDTSDASDLNTPLADIAADLNIARPVVAGGTGVTSKSAFKASYDLEIGTDLQAYSASLTEIAGLASTASRSIRRNSSGVWETLPITGYAVTLLDDADAGTARATLGLGDAATRAISFDEDYTVDGTALSPRYLTKIFVDASIAASPQGLGAGQTWQDVSASRAHSTSYQNTTGRSIFVAIVADAGSALRNLQVSTDNTTWITVGAFEEITTSRLSASTVVPNGSYYRINGTATITSWAELR